MADIRSGSEQCGGSGTISDANGWYKCPGCSDCTPASTCPTCGSDDSADKLEINAGGPWEDCPDPFHTPASPGDEGQGERVTFTQSNVERVKVSTLLLGRLSEWSKPVRIKIEGRDKDGDLELILETVPDSIPRSEVEAFAQTVRKEVANIDRAYIEGDGCLRGWALEAIDCAASALLERDRK